MPKEIEVYRPLKGQLYPIEQVQDPVFSKKMLGDGFAIHPEDQQILSPIEGEIKVVYPTGHAIGLVNAGGVEILLHLGIDTVELEGRPFNVLVKKGQYVKKGTPLAMMDYQLIEQEGYDSSLIFILLSKQKLIVEKNGHNHSEKVAIIELE